MRALGGRVLRLRPDTQCQVEDAAVVRAGQQAHGDPDAAGISGFGFSDDVRVDGGEGEPRFVRRVAWIVDSPPGHLRAGRERSDCSVSPRASCAVCGAAARDAALDGWHVFEDPSGDEHLVCRACLSDG